MYGNELVFVSFISNAATDCEFGAVGEVYVYRKAAKGRTLARGQALLKFSHRHIFQLTVEERTAQQAGLCKP